MRQTSRQPLDAVNLTVLLQAWRAGDRDAEARLVTAIYPRLREIAARQLAKRPGMASLRVTELVNEWYLNVENSAKPNWRDRAHFFAIAARQMRNILVDQARMRMAAKRGGDVLTIHIDSAYVGNEPPELEILALDRWLDRLATADADAARVVELRFFAGLTIEEVAEALGLGRATVVRRWRFARAWLRQRLEPR